MAATAAMSAACRSTVAGFSGRHADPCHRGDGDGCQRDGRTLPSRRAKRPSGAVPVGGGMAQPSPRCRVSRRAISPAESSVGPGSGEFDPSDPKEHSGDSHNGSSSEFTGVDSAATTTHAAPPAPRRNGDAVVDAASNAPVPPATADSAPAGPRLGRNGDGAGAGASRPGQVTWPGPGPGASAQSDPSQAAVTVAGWGPTLRGVAAGSPRDSILPTGTASTASRFVQAQL